MEFGDGRGISWTTCKQSAPGSRQITTAAPHHSIFTGRMLFLTPNQQCQSTESDRESRVVRRSVDVSAERRRRQTTKHAVQYELAHRQLMPVSPRCIPACVQEATCAQKSPKRHSSAVTRPKHEKYPFQWISIEELSVLLLSLFIMLSSCRSAWW